MTNMNFILIPANSMEPITIHEASQLEAFDKMREKVGYIAVINLPADNAFAPLHQMYVDEEASFKPSSTNIRATLILSADTALLGDVVIAVRPSVVTDEEGDTEVFFPTLSEETKANVLRLNISTER